MADDTELKVKISALDELSPALLKACDAVDQVQQGVNKLADSAVKAKDGNEGLNTGVVNLAAGLDLLKTGYELVSGVVERFGQQVEKAVDTALEAERSHNLLVGALVATGQYSQKASDEVEQYAASTMKATGANEETIISHVAMGVQMGLSVDRAKDMEEASRKLSVVTGGDVNQAFMLLQQTLAGHSRGLARVLPQIKDLGTAQLASGAAIDIVNQSLTAQYEMYQGSFQAGLDRAKTGVNEVYKEIGNLIVQSPAVREAIDAFGKVMLGVAEDIKSFGEWLSTHKQDIKDWGTAFMEAGAVVGGTWLVIMAANTAATLSFASVGAAAAAAWTVITGPVGLAVIAITALTAAFVKWPPLFDIVIGSIKTLIGVALLPMAGAIGGTILAIGAFTEIVNKSWGQSIEDAGTKIIKMTADLTASGAAQVAHGVSALANGEAVKKSADTQVKANEDVLSAESRVAAARANAMKYYGDYEIGTYKQEQALVQQKQDRDKALSDFTKYYDDKIALTVSKENEAAEKIASFKSKALGTGGTSGVGADAKSAAEIEAEKNKQTKLKAMLDEELITEQDYARAMLDSVQTEANDELAIRQRQQTAIMGMLGKSTEAAHMHEQQLKENYQQDLDQSLAQAELMGATQDQLNAIKVEKEKQLQEQIHDIRQKALADELAREQKENDAWGASLTKMRMQQEKEGKLLGTVHALQQDDYYKTEMTMLGNLATLRSSHSKTAFEIGKKAALAQATIQTFMSATEAYAAMASIPIVGPALGAIAAAAAIAAGMVQIQGINSQQFSKAHGGLDEVPSSLDNTTFLLKGGERVVQPEANKDLTSFLKDQKGGNGSSNAGTTINATVTVAVNGSATQDDMRKTAEALVEELRRMSERGDQIISAKGVY